MLAVRGHHRLKGGTDTKLVQQSVALMAGRMPRVLKWLQDTQGCQRDTGLL